MKNNRGFIGLVIGCFSIFLIIAIFQFFQIQDMQEEAEGYNEMASSQIDQLESFLEEYYPEESPSPIPSPSPSPSPSPTIELVTEEEIDILVKVVYREAGSVEGYSQKAAVVWCILNRVDSGMWGGTVKEVATQPYQFAWDPNTPIVPEIKEIVEDVISRWEKEKAGEEGVGRVLPQGYYYFMGDGIRNYYTKEYGGKDYWDWGLPSPY